MPPRKQRNRDQPERRLVDQLAEQSAGTWAMSASGVSSRSTGG